MKKENWVFAVLGILIALAAGGVTFYRVFKSRKDFFDSLLPDALQLHRETGIDPLITLTQAAHESGFGANPDNQLVYTYRNLFGIKAGSSWKGPVAEPTTTHEVIAGKRITVKDTERASRFRAYPSYLASMRDWASLLVRLYPRAYAAAQEGNIKAFADGLLTGTYKYATDPAYKTALVSVRQTVGGLA